MDQALCESTEPNTEEKNCEVRSLQTLFQKQNETPTWHKVEGLFSERLPGSSEQGSPMRVKIYGLRYYTIS